MRLAAAGNAGDLNTVRVILEKYLKHVRDKFKPTALNNRQRTLRPFANPPSMLWASDRSGATSETTKPQPPPAGSMSFRAANRPRRRPSRRRRTGP
jgi:hypothetical protein